MTLATGERMDTIDARRPGRPSQRHSLVTAVWLKTCPRCGGDLYRGVDVDGVFLACLQCGHYPADALAAR